MILLVLNKEENNGIPMWTWTNTKYQPSDQLLLREEFGIALKPWNRPDVYNQELALLHEKKFVAH